MHPGENLLVLHEELGGDPLKISLTTRTGQHLCGHVSDADHPSADSWKPNLDFKSQKPEVRLACDQGYTIASIPFASYGTPEGVCGAFSHGDCHANVLSTVQQVIKVFHSSICTVKSAGSSFFYFLFFNYSLLCVEKVWFSRICQCIF